MIKSNHIIERPDFTRFMQLNYSAGGHLFTRHISQRIGALFAWLALKLKATPNMVTGLAAILMTLGAVLFAFFPAGWHVTLATLVIMQLSYALDCADGQLARATGKSSALGAWWDVYCDFYAVILVSAALFHFLVGFNYTDFSLALPIIMIFTFCRCASLYSSTYARMVKVPDSDEGQQRHTWPRQLFTMSLDTPLVLLFICLLREAPILLAAYLVLASPLYFLHSVYTGLKFRDA